MSAPQFDLFAAAALLPPAAAASAQRDGRYNPLGTITRHISK